MAKTKPIRVGIAGLGRAGYCMQCAEIQGYPEKFTLVAGCDPYEPWRKRAAETYPSCAVYKTLDELLKDPNVDLLSIATASSDHYAHAMAALRTGKDVLLEKPMAVTFAEAQRLCSAAAKAKGRLFIRHNRRFEPGFQHIRQIVASGILGEVYDIRLARTSYQRRDDWQTLERFGGGQLRNWGPHIIDHGLQFLGAPKKPLKHLWACLKKVVAAGDAEDYLNIVMAGANDCVVNITISGGAAINLPVYYIAGSRGALTADDHTITLRYLDPHRKLPARKPIITAPRNDMTTPEDLPWIEQTLPVAPDKPLDYWEELYKAIRLKKPFVVTLDEALEVMRVISEVKKVKVRSLASK